MFEKRLFGVGGEGRARAPRASLGLPHNRERGGLSLRSVLSFSGVARREIRSNCCFLPYVSNSMSLISLLIIANLDKGMKI